MSKHCRNTAAFTLVLMLGSSLAVVPSFAADTSASAPKTGAQAGMTSTQPGMTAAQTSMMDKRLMVSNDGFKAERELGSARIAIFQGNTDAAKTLVKDAQADLKTVAQQAPKDFPNGAPTADGKGSGNADIIPIDGQMVVADNMVLTPDKIAKVKEANEHLKNGDTDKAMDTLKQGAIDVAFTRVLMPIKETDVHVDAAATLLDQGKYYEANLALKAAQDLLQTDTVSFGDTAAQAAKMTGMPSVASSTTGTSTDATASAPAKK